MSASVKVCDFFIGAPGDPMTNTSSPMAKPGEKRVGLDTTGRLAEFVSVCAGEALTALQVCMRKAGTAATNDLAWTAMKTAAIDSVPLGVPPFIIDSGSYGFLQRTGFLANVAADSLSYTVGDKICVGATAGTVKKFDPTLTTGGTTAAEVLAALKNAYTIFGEAAETASTTALDMKLYCRG